ncbi:unnamed protein product [Cylicostephanus goldi]|uniref:DUF4440 domain-containing protein n=1 Tax=Cylicostephanus goldi TaxID=71465 RepID=A0A3P6U5U7_CYLGO|nr:unnamed protein product [Cylicostephanus goldi]
MQKPLFDLFSWSCGNVFRSVTLIRPLSSIIHTQFLSKEGRGVPGNAFSEIKRHLLEEYDRQRGGTSMKSWSDEHYQMTEDYIIVDGHYKTETEKVGNMDGEFHMIWKKSNGKYLIKRNEYDEE